ncbi:MAG: Gfo/Idh/MocA family oxidoreductase [Candidatus Latescibacterota bacterium]|nr:Gfo/Idh/MocA family oxidoreductase [Candidatus Latescibacterota bacterium]
MSKIRWAQIGTKHGHAAGKLRALQTSPNVEVAGIYEPDQDRRIEVAEQDSYSSVHWFDDVSEIHEDNSIVAVASEGANIESLDQTEALIDAGKHVWYDKPAGCNWEQWQKIIATAEEKELLIQLGYMFRYHAAFNQIDEWQKSGFLGDITSIRGHMSTSLPKDRREALNIFKAGIFYDLGAHMLDQVCWLLGRPHSVSSFLRNDSDAQNVVDNSVTVYEFDKAIAFLDISSFESRPAARRFEVYGTKGSAIILEPFEPGDRIRLCIDEAREGYPAAEQIVEIEGRSRQTLYELALQSFLSTIAGAKKRDRPAEHELLVQETLLRATGDI